MCFRLDSCFGGGKDDFGTHSSPPPRKASPRGGNAKDHRKGRTSTYYSDDEPWRKNLHDVPAHREEDDADNAHAHAYPDNKAYHHAPAYAYPADKAYQYPVVAAVAEPPRPAVARNNNYYNKVAAHDHHAGGGYKTDHESAMAMVYHYPAPTTNTLARY